MYTFYFQSVPSLGGNMFRLTAHNTYAEDPSLGELYPEETLSILSQVGYRIVIDPSPANLARMKRNEFLEREQPLQLAPGFRAIYPPTMFAIPRTEFQTDKLPATLPPNSGDVLRYTGPSDGMDSNAANGVVDGFKADQQDAAFDEQANRLDSSIGRDHYFSRARCGEDIPPSEKLPPIEDMYVHYRGAPSAGPLPPQAPLAPTEKVDEYGVPEVGDFFKIDGKSTNDIREAAYVVRKEYLTAQEILDIYGIVVVSRPGLRGWTVEDGVAPSNPPPIPPEGSMLLPPTFEGKPVLQGPVSPTGPKNEYGVMLPYEGELPANAKLAAAIYGAIHDDLGIDVSPEKPKGFWQLIKDFFNGGPTSYPNVP